MNHHKNARLTPFSRELLVRRITEQGLRPEEAAQACGVSVRTAYKWLARYRAEGLSGLQNRSSRPSRSPHGTPEALVEQIVQRRRQRQTYLTISKALGVAHSTISRLMRRRGLNRLCLLDPPKRWSGMSTTAPVACSTWISRNSATSTGPDTGSIRIGVATLVAVAGAMSMWPLMITPESLSVAFTPMRRAQQPARRCWPPWRTTGAGSHLPAGPD